MKFLCLRRCAVFKNKQKKGFVQILFCVFRVAIQYAEDAGRFIVRAGSKCQLSVSQYYKKQLKPGESLWWAADADVEETVAPPTVKLWSALTPEEKNVYTVKGYALFPEILTPNSTKKYQRYALWLATNCGVINTNIRDQFSAGGRVDIVTDKGVYEKMPAAFGRIVKYKDLIIDTIITENSDLLKEYWELLDSVPENRILYWCQLVALAAGKNSKSECEKIYCMLRTIFNL